MATIREVAKRAGVAPITVSRVINNSDYVSQAARKRVETAIVELGYVPNGLARSLRSKRTNTLALILTDITNPFFTTMARGVEDAASDGKFSVIFCNTDESEEEERKYLQVVLQQRVDGILLVPARSKADSVEFIHRHRTPVVVLDRRMPVLATDVVRGDSEGGAYQLARLLLSLGHRHIALLGGPLGVSTTEDRALGFRRAMREANLDVPESLMVYGAYSQPSGYEMVQKALASDPQPTAIFAANNFIATGALKYLQSVGLRVPEDIALVCFDELHPLAMAFPFFTVAAQPAYEMGQKATELLLARLSGGLAEHNQEIVLPVEIRVRQSSGMPRGDAYKITSSSPASVLGAAGEVGWG